MLFYQILKMATDTWKGSERRDRTRTYDYSNQDYYIGNHGKGRTFSYSNSFSGHTTTRETGVVEKLLHSYGFINCCERELRIFFHYSQINEDPQDLCIGDEMEFEISSDQRTGKPIACRVVRLEAGSVSFEIRSEETVCGVIDAEPKLYLKSSPKSPQNVLDPDSGRVSYERNGEVFYLQFSSNDIVGSGIPLHKGDKVEFYVATDKRTGVVRAREVTLLEAADTEKCQGVVSSMKESFGFIERADKVSEIFFHYSEFNGNINELMLGDDVEFGIQARNGKEVAVRVDKLPEGTVKFEDISSERYQGTVDRPLSKSAAKRQHDPLHGKIVYTPLNDDDVEEEIVFSERDLHGDFSLRIGDVVEFNIAVDRRDSLKRATNISLVDVAEPNDGETRELGIVASLKEGFGFIKCCDRDARMFFHYSALLDSAHQIQVGDEVEFAVSEDTSSIKRLHAIKVRVVPKGTIIQMEKISSQMYEGYIEREPSYGTRSPRKDINRESESGLINCFINGVKELLPFDFNNFELRGVAQYGDLVEFSLSESQRTGYRRAVNVTVLKRNSEMRHMGFVATLKENFGFLETTEHDKEVFFHYSEYDGDPNELILGDEVEYNIKCKNGKVSAEMVVKVPQGTITQEQILPEVYVGKVLRSLRRADPQQLEYAGLIKRRTTEDQESGSENEAEEDLDNDDSFTVEYGITSLVDKKTVLQYGDKVRFQVGVDKQTEREIAMKVVSVRQRVRARVESVKGQFGFIAYENEEGKNLFFHMSEVEGEVELQPGDEVEFVVVQNQKSRKMSACSVRRISDSQRPERLIRRTFSESVQSPGPRIEVIRKPSGPDGTRGFSYKRTLRSLSDTATELTQGTSESKIDHNPAKLENVTCAKEGSEFENLVSKLCDQD